MRMCGWPPPSCEVRLAGTTAISSGSTASDSPPTATSITVRLQSRQVFFVIALTSDREVYTELRRLPAGLVFVVASEHVLLELLGGRGAPADRLLRVHADHHHLVRRGDELVDQDLHVLLAARGVAPGDLFGIGELLCPRLVLLFDAGQLELERVLLVAQLARLGVELHHVVVDEIHGHGVDALADFAKLLHHILSFSRSIDSIQATATAATWTSSLRSAARSSLAWPPMVSLTS